MLRYQCFSPILTDDGDKHADECAWFEHSWRGTYMHIITLLPDTYHVIHYEVPLGW